MNAEGAVQLPAALAHPPSPLGAAGELYPSAIRSLLASWHAVRLERYLVRPRDLKGERAVGA